MAIKSPQGKGKGGEYEVIALLGIWAREVGVTLTLERNLEQVRYGGADINGVPGMEVEVKRVETATPAAVDQWWAQVCRASAKSGKTPFLIHRQNRREWRVRVRTTVALHNDLTTAWDLFPVDADLDLRQAKKWFQKYVQIF